MNFLLSVFNASFIANAITNFKNKFIYFRVLLGIKNMKIQLNGDF